MRIVFMGSAAAEAVPSLWCRCECCRKAAANGGKDIRRRTCYKIDEDTLVDFGPDAFWQMQEFGVDCEKIKRLFHTHQHEDHFNPVELSWRHRGYARDVLPLDLYGTPEVQQRGVDVMAAIGADDPSRWENTVFHTMQPGDALDAGDGMTVLAIPANHSAVNSLNYLITRGGKSVLIAHDTGFWQDAAWRVMEGHTADAVIFDGTCGTVNPDAGWKGGHMGCRTGVKFRDELLKRGMLKPNGLAVANHFSHNGNSLQANLEGFFASYGIEVGFDGKVIEL